MYRKVRSIYLEGGYAKRILFSLTVFPLFFRSEKTEISNSLFLKCI